MSCTDATKFSCGNAGRDITPIVHQNPQSKGISKVLGGGLEATLLQKGCLPETERFKHQIGGRKPNGSKSKLAISRITNKNSQLRKSAKRDENERIADFNLRKSAAIFAKKNAGQANSTRQGRICGQTAETSPRPTRISQNRDFRMEGKIHGRAMPSPYNKMSKNQYRLI